MSLFRTWISLRALSILPARVLLPALILLCGCTERKPAALLDLRAQAEQALARAMQLKAESRELQDKEALGELLKARLISRSAGLPELEARALNEIGALEFRRDRFSQANRFWEQALALARHARDLAGEAAALNGLGDVHLEKSAVTESEGHEGITAYQEALRLSRAAGDPVLEGKVLYNLANAFQAQRDRPRSLAYYEQALAIQVRNGDRSGRRLSLRGLGELYADQRDYARALDTLEKALAESRAAKDRDAEAHLLMSLGSVYLPQEKMEKALESYDEARQLFRQAGAPLKEGRACIQLASTNLYLGERDQATVFYKLGIELVERQAREQQLGLPRELAIPLAFLGTHLQPEIGFDRARKDYHLRALELVESAPESPDLERVKATVYHFYGRALNNAGRPREALHFLAEADPQMQQRESSWARNRLELGKARRALGDRRQAEQELRGALALSRKLHDFLLEAVALHELARLEKDRGNYPSAVAQSGEALRIFDAIRSKVASQHLRTSFFASRQIYYKFHIELLMELHRREPHKRYDHAAFETSERARARVLLDLLAEGRINIAHRLKSQEQELQRRISGLQNRLFRGRGDAALERDLLSAERDRLQLEAKIRSENPRYAEILNPVIRSVGEIQALLSPRTALLEIALAESSTFLFVVTREGFQSYRLPDTPEQLERRVQSLNADLLNRANPLTFNLHAAENHELYRTLLGQAEALLREKEYWLIAAEGPLLLLNFEVLLTRPSTGTSFDQPYLLRERSIYYIPSASVLAEIMAKKSGPPVEVRRPALDFFALGDPDTANLAGPRRGANGRLALPRLVEARKEVRGIEQLFPRDKIAVFLGREATEAAVKTNGDFGNSRRIHFATHGTFDAERPENSALLLAPSPREDGRLTVGEIFNLRTAAELVVLSACNTGQGKQVAGEGLVGMTRAFFYAGAPTLVVSLWPADDLTTARLMTSFYRHMQRTHDKVAALRSAKLELIEEEPPGRWAPFILLGQAVGGAP